MKRKKSQTNILLIFLFVSLILPMINIPVNPKNYFHYMGYCFLMTGVLLQILQYFFKGEMIFFRGIIDYKETKASRISRLISLILFSIMFLGMIWFIYFQK